MQKTSILILLVAAHSLAMSPVELASAVAHVRNRVLTAEHDCGIPMRWSVEKFGWTPSDCSAILVGTYEQLKTSDNPQERHAAENAISLLGDFGDTDALPFLASLLKTESGWLQELSGSSYLLITEASPASIAPVDEAMKQNTLAPESFARRMTSRLDRCLTFGGPEQRLQSNIILFC